MTDGGTAAERPATDGAALENAALENAALESAPLESATPLSPAPEGPAPEGPAHEGPAPESGPAAGSTAPSGSGRVTAPRRRRIVLISVIAAGVLVVDQVTKSLAVEHLSNQRIHLVGPFYLALSYNTGVAFSIGTGLTLPIIIIAGVIVGSIAWLSRGSISLLGAVAFGLILGGAIGNLSDRLFRSHHGAVVDFLYSGFWPTFNVADACIVVGSFLLALSQWRGRAP